MASGRVSLKARFRVSGGFQYMADGQTARRARLGIIIAGVAGLMLAVNDVSVPFSYHNGFSPPTVVLARYGFLLLTVALLLAALRVRPRLPTAERGHALGSGVMTAIATMGLLGSFAFIPVSLAVVILYTFPMLTALFECLHARRFPGLAELLCLIAAFAGVGIAVGLNDVALEPMGLLLAGLASLCYAISMVWNGIALRHADSTVVSFHMAIAGIFTVALYVVATGSFQLTPQTGLAPWLPLLVTCFFFSVAFVLMFRAVTLCGAAPTAMVLNLEPVFVLFLAATLLGEELTLPRLLGGALVIGAVVMSEIVRGRRDVAIGAVG